MSSIGSVTKQMERKNDGEYFVPFILMMVLLIVLIITPRKEDVLIAPQAKIIFENEKTICFQKEDIGTWCVDKTIKDIWVWDKK